jgi:hypothetical protein
LRPLLPMGWLQLLGELRRQTMRSGRLRRKLWDVPVRDDLQRDRVRMQTPVRWVDVRSGRMRGHVWNVCLGPNV